MALRYCGCRRESTVGRPTCRVRQVSPWWIKYAGLPDLPYRVIVISGKRIELNEEGYLVNHSDWSEEVAGAMAKTDNCELTDKHWEVIHFLREYYEQYQIPPNVRVLAKAMAKKHGPEKGNNKYLYELFPYGPGKQGYKYASLPKLGGCV